MSDLCYNELKMAYKSLLLPALSLITSLCSRADYESVTGPRPPCEFCGLIGISTKHLFESTLPHCFSFLLLQPSMHSKPSSCFLSPPNSHRSPFQAVKINFKLIMKTRGCTGNKAIAFCQTSARLAGSLDAWTRLLLLPPPHEFTVYLNVSQQSQLVYVQQANTERFWDVPEELAGEVFWNKNILCLFHG